MTYQRFRARKIDWTPATVATLATVQEEIAQSVANVASVAEGRECFSRPLTSSTPAEPSAVPAPSTGDADDLAMEAEERAAIFEFDAGLPRMEAERLAFGRPPTPGITIRAPAVELSAAEYDRHLDALIASAGVDTPEASRLAYAKRKGWVVPRGDETVFTRGR